MSPSSPHRHEAPFRACIGEAAQRGRLLMERMVQGARQSLPQRIALANDARERELQQESLRLLLQFEGRLRENYPQALLAEFAQAIAGNTEKEAAGGLSFDALELMGEDQIQESVEVARAQQATLLAVEGELGELNALICAAQGLKSVQAERNPLRPDIYVRGLRGVLADTGVPVPVRMRWLSHLGEALGPALARDYVHLSDMLREQGVVAAGFNVIMQMESPAAARAQAGGTGGASAAPGGAPPRPETLLTVRQLRRLLSGELDAGGNSFDEKFAREFEGPGHEVPHADFSPTVPAAFEALQEMKQVDEVMQRLAQRNAEGAPATLREQLRSTASTSQALGLEVVNLMLDNIANDARLLPEVQAVVRELEPALLRLALIDPRFFSDKRHPARRFLDLLIQKSLAWQSASAPGFDGFIDPARQAVQALVGTHIEGAEPFAYALHTLEETWAEQQKRERRKREKAVRALLQAEQRNLLAEKIARDLRQRAETAGAPRGIVYFVTGPWAQVIAQARLLDSSGQADPGGYQDLVTDLLWSSIPQVASTNPARLARLIPDLLSRLREGLESIGYSRSKSGRFFDELMVLHARASQPAAPLDDSPRGRLEAQFREADEAGLWLAPSEQHQSGFMETQPPQTNKPLFELTQPAFSETLLEGVARAEPAEPPAPQALSLAPGAWVELRLDDAWTRTQLTWASPHGTLFMFTQADGVNHSMTRQSIDRLFAGGNLRVLAQQAVVEGALDAVAQAALRNSVDFTL
ncbi:MAG: DUF1631 family protein [Ramlibacter sp.]